MRSNFEQGRHDARTYYQSKALASFDRNISPEQAIKIYLPPVKEQLTQIATPMPKDRQEWMQGFKQEQVKILIELSLET